MSESPKSLVAIFSALRFVNPCKAAIDELRLHNRKAAEMPGLSAGWLVIGDISTHACCTGMLAHDAHSHRGSTPLEFRLPSSGRGDSMQTLGTVRNLHPGIRSGSCFSADCRISDFPMSCNWAAGPASMGSLGSSSPQRDCATAGRAPNRWSLDGAPCRNQGSSCGEVATENSSQADVVSEEKAKRKLQFISEKYEELRKLHHEHAAAEARSTEATLNSLKAEARALSGQVDDATGRRHVPPEHRF